jgi:hypothetical protein
MDTMTVSAEGLFYFDDGCCDVITFCLERVIQI